jgi:hypothetical protein
MLQERGPQVRVSDGQGPAQGAVDGRGHDSSLLHGGSRNRRLLHRPRWRTPRRIHLRCVLLSCASCMCKFDWILAWLPLFAGRDSAHVCHAMPVWLPLSRFNLCCTRCRVRRLLMPLCLMQSHTCKNTHVLYTCQTVVSVLSR